MDDLDDVDRRIMDLVLGGASNRAIARELDLPEGTVKWRLHRLYRRLGVDSHIQFANAVRQMRGEA